jgi:hypothetical protein
MFDSNLVHLFPNARQGPTEVAQSVEIGPVTRLLPLWMIDVLFSAAGIPAGCLNMSARFPCDPHIFPGRGNHKGFDACDQAFIPYALSRLSPCCTSRGSCWGGCLSADYTQHSFLYRLTRTDGSYSFCPLWMLRYSTLVSIQFRSHEFCTTPVRSPEACGFFYGSGGRRLFSGSTETAAAFRNDLCGEISVLC